jgi:hypothetical protein
VTDKKTEVRKTISKTKKVVLSEAVNKSVQIQAGIDKS